MLESFFSTEMAKKDISAASFLSKVRYQRRVKSQRNQVHYQKIKLIVTQSSEAFVSAMVAISPDKSKNEQDESKMKRKKVVQF